MPKGDDPFDPEARDGRRASQGRILRWMDDSFAEDVAKGVETSGTHDMDPDLAEDILRDQAQEILNRREDDLERIQAGS